MCILDLKLLLADNCPFGQRNDYRIRELLRGLADRPQVNLGRTRGLVRRVDAREILDLVGLRLRIVPFRVTPCAFLDRRVNEDLDKICPRASGCAPCRARPCRVI